jgi:hypothetical protein
MPDERSRLEVVQALSEKFGPEVAAALMECVPPFSWMEIVTKRDLAEFEQRLNLRFDMVDARFGAIDTRFGAIDARFDAIDTRFDAIDARFGAVGARFGELGSHLDARLHAEVTRSIRWTVGAVFSGLTVVAGAAVGIAAILA